MRERFAESAAELKGVNDRVMNTILVDGKKKQPTISEYYAQWSIQAMAIRFPLIAFGLLILSATINDEMHFIGMEKTLNEIKRIDGRMRELEAEASKSGTTLAGTNKTEDKNGINANVELKRIARLKATAAIGMLSAILFIFHGCTGFRERKLERKTQYAFVGPLTNWMPVVPSLSRLGARVIVFRLGIFVFSKVCSMARLLSRPCCGETICWFERMVRFVAGRCLVAVLWLFMRGFDSEFQQCMKMIEALEAKRNTAGHADGVELWVSDLQVKLVRLDSSLVGIYLNPMTFGAGILLTVAGVNYDGIQESFEPGLSVLLGVGTSLVAWHLTTMYERGMERRRLKVLILCSLQEIALIESAISQIEMLYQYLSPNLSLILMNLVAKYRVNKDASVISEFRTEISTWV